MDVSSSIVEKAERRPRLGRRGETLRQAVLDAAVSEIAEAGPNTASVQGVAARAGVHETSIYRRWKTRENLFQEALIACSRDAIPAPDTGSLRGDLVALVRLVAEFITSPLGHALLQGGVQASDDHIDAQRAFWASRRKVLMPIIDRAKQRGVIRPDVDARLVLELLAGPLQFRVLFTREELDPALAEQITDIVLSGITNMG